MAGVAEGEDQSDLQETQGKGLTPEEQAEKLKVHEWDSAIEHGSASFSQLATAYFASLPRNTDRADRSKAIQYRPDLLEAFEMEYGQVTSSWWGDYVNVAVVQTKGKAGKECELHITHAAGIMPEADRLLFRVDKISIGAHRLLKGQDREICIDGLYGVTTHVLAVVDGQAGPDPPDLQGVSSILEQLESELDEAEVFEVQAAQRRAQIDYFMGMLVGVVALSLVTLALLRLSSLVGILTSAVTPLAASLLAGGVGALVSVMSRMHGGGLELDYEAGTLLLRLLGVFRPVIGSIMAAALFVLILSGLLPVQVPTESSVQIYFFAGVGFLAGFSERFAQDMLVKSEGQLRTA